VDRGTIEDGGGRPRDRQLVEVERATIAVKSVRT
jgi:hypothetical protein